MKVCGTIPPLSESDKRRFNSKLKRSASGCLEFQGYREIKMGYTRFRIGARKYLAHRIAWFLAFGEPPALVLHHCDNPCCCEVSHLWIGNDADNAQDREAKQRHKAARGNANGSRLHPDRLARGDNHYARVSPERLARGEGNGSAKLTAPDILEIRRIYATEKLSHRKIGARFGVSGVTVGRVISGSVWAHI